MFSFSVKNKPEQLVASDGRLPYLCIFCGHVCSRKFVFDFAC